MLSFIGGIGKLNLIEPSRKQKLDNNTCTALQQRLKIDEDIEK